jgi:hypothetical protein
MNRCTYDKTSLVQWRILDTPVSFIGIIVLCDDAFKYGDCVRFWGYIEMNTEPLCVDFCNFVQCHIFVNSLTS